jgi:hypothetical protein
MKIRALILAAGTILAFAAPAVAAGSSVQPGGSARSANAITPAGPQTTVVFRDLMPVGQGFRTPLERKPSPATVELVTSGQVGAALAPRPGFWELLASWRLHWFLYL